MTGPHCPSWDLPRPSGHDVRRRKYASVVSSQHEAHPEEQLSHHQPLRSMGMTLMNLKAYVRIRYGGDGVRCLPSANSVPVPRSSICPSHTSTTGATCRRMLCRYPSRHIDVTAYLG